MRDIRLEVHRLRPGEWEQGAATWESLFQRVPSASPYLSTPWVSSWIDTFAASLECWQLVVQNADNTVVGSCLLARKLDRRAIVPLRQLYLNTAGENDADSVVMEYNALLCLPEYQDAVLHAVADHVVGLSADEFMVCGGTESILSAFASALPEWRAITEWRESPYVDLEVLRAASQGHLEVVSRNTREQLRRSLRKYGERGTLTVDVASTTSDAAQLFDRMVALHEARWRGLGELGGFATARRKQFHAAFIAQGAAGGYAQLLQVSAGSHLIGVLYNVVANGCVCFYQSGLRYEDDKHLKPGLVVHHLAIEHYLAAGYRDYDFLPSSPGEGRYKQSLSTSARRLGTLCLQRPGLRRSYFDAARKAKRALSVQPSGTTQ